MSNEQQAAQEQWRVAEFGPDYPDRMKTVWEIWTGEGETYKDAILNHTLRSIAEVWDKADLDRIMADHQQSAALAIAEKAREEEGQRAFEVVTKYAEIVEGLQSQLDLANDQDLPNALNPDCCSDNELRKRAVLADEYARDLRLRRRERLWDFERDWLARYDALTASEVKNT